MCACGSKATVNARLDASGTILTTGSQVFLEAKLTFCDAMEDLALVISM